MKTCDEPGCTYPIWARSKCKYHDDMRKRIKNTNKPKGSVKNGISIKTLDIAFSRYIRTKASKDEIITCYICEEPVSFNQSVLMHYLGRGNNSIRYEERNCKAGCVKCNSFLGGNLEKFEEKLIEEYGSSILNDLKSLSKQIWKITQEERFQLLQKWNKYLSN